jgi:predicted Rossmann-fold nucleotide-binding protein
MELRDAFKIFAPYRHIRKVSIFGSGRPLSSHPDYVQAESFARLMRLRNWMVITRAGEGIMGAGQAGAGRAGSFGVAIRLPPEQNANEVILADPKLIDFKYFFTCEILFLREASALCLFPGRFFAHDEGLEALTMIQTGIANLMPVIMIDAPGGSYWQEWQTYVKRDSWYNDMISEENMNLSMLTDDVDAAVEEITGFYRRFHSMRYVGPKLVLRINSPLPAQMLQQLNDTYCGILTAGRIEQCAGPVEGEDGEYPDMPRLALQFNRKNVGTLRLLVDEINKA